MKTTDFKEGILDIVKPALLKEGFKGRSKKFTKKNDDVVFDINFNISKYHLSHNISTKVGVSIFYKEIKTSIKESFFLTQWV